MKNTFGSPALEDHGTREADQVSWRLKLALIVLGFFGCLSLYWLPTQPLKGLSAEQLRIAQLVQPILLVIGAVFLGGRYAPRTGVAAPLISSALCGHVPSAPRWLVRTIAMGVLTALASWLLFLCMKPFLPPKFIAAAQTYDPPFLVRVFYGGLSEEVMCRWGVMSWLLGMFRLRTKFLPPGTTTWIAAIATALLFAAGHLPFANQIAGGSSVVLTVFVLAANLPLGLAAGLSFAKHGLEAAMLMHMTAGALLALLGKLG